MRGYEAKGAKDFVMPMSEAKGMAADLTELLLEIRTLKESVLAGQQDEVIQVQIDGGGFK